MKKNTKILIFMVLMVFTNLFFITRSVRTQELKQAPDFRLRGLDNNTVTLGSYRDKQAVLLLFWTTWCPYCRQQLKALNNTYSQLQDGGLRVLAVNVGEPSVKVERFVQDYGLAFSIVLDENARVAEAYQVMGVPTYAIISKEGNLVFKDNYFPGADYKNLISR